MPSWAFNKISSTFPISAPFIKRLMGQGVGATLVRGTGGAFIINALGNAITFVTHVILARSMGAESYGTFFYAFTWMIVLNLIGLVGLENASLRFVAEYNGTQQWGLLKGYLRRSWQVVFISSTFIAMLFAGVVYIIRHKINYELACTFWVSALILPIYGLLVIQGMSLRGMKLVAKALTPSILLRTSTLMFGAMALYFIFSQKISAPVAMTVNLVAFTIAFLVSNYFLNRATPTSPEFVTAKPEYKTGFWIRTAIPMLFFASVLQMEAQTDTLIIGFFLKSGDVGVYAVARKIANLTSFVLGAVVAIAAPMISELYAKGEKEKLQKMLTWVSRGIFFFVLSFVMIVAPLGKYVLGLFGNEFVRGYDCLLILMIGTFIKNMAGISPFVLLMTGGQKVAAYILLFTFAVCLVLNVTLIPRLGIIGASISTASAVSLQSIAFFIAVMRLVGLNTSPLKLHLSLFQKP